MDLLNNNDMPNDGEGPSISRSSDDLPPVGELTAEEEEKIKEKLKKVFENREASRDDMLRIMQDTHKILSEEVVALRSDLDRKFTPISVRMNSRSPNPGSEGGKSSNENLDNRRNPEN